MSLVRVYKSYSKINIALKVTGVLPGGFHSLEMVNMPLSLSDDITISISPEGCKTIVLCDALGDLPMEKNICYKAVELLRSKYRFNESVTVSIDKHIPFEAGLGGGSSNAATTLLALNEMLSLGIDYDVLCALGLQLGSDVPYFIRPLVAKLEGKGEIITPFKAKNHYYCLLVKPSFGLSTKAVYSICDEFERERIDIKGVIESLETGNDDRLATCIGNDLQKAACSLGSQIQDIINLMRHSGLPLSNMTGSGSTVFALSMRKNELERVSKALPAECSWYICETL